MGNQYEINYSTKYNYESQVSLVISLTKIAYSKGETVTGIMFLKTKPYLQETILINPQASISLIEFQHSGDPDTDFDIYSNSSNNKLSKREKIYFTYPLNLYSYNGANLFVVWTHQCLLNDGMTTMSYLIPLFIISYSLLIWLSSYLPGDIIYCAIYTLFATYLGYLLYIF